MKRRTKLLSVFLTLTMGVAAIGALAGCDNDDGTNEAEDLISQVQTSIDGKQSELEQEIDKLEEQLAEPSKVHTHEWGEAIVLREATCEEDGFSVQYCACGEDKLTVQNADGEHAWGETVVLSEATCLTFGGAIRFCEICQTVEHILLEKVHRYDEYGLCIACQPLSSRGLEFTLSEDESSYSLTDVGSCKDDKISIPATVYGKPVTSIGSSAFEGCSKLTSITIPDSVTSIGTYAFWDCTNLTEIVIPASVTSIGSSAFEGCSKLTSILVDDNNEHYRSIDGNLYSKDGKTLIQYAIGKTDASFTIPDSVTSIGTYAFYGCSSLTNVTIGNGVTSISNGAFKGCSSLTSITIPDGVTSIGSFAFYDCSGLTSITIPDSVTSIGDWAFRDCSSLTYTIKDGLKYLGNTNNPYLYLAGTETKTITTATIENGCKFIGDYAFASCSSLTSVTIPDSVTSIGGYGAFLICTNLTEIVIPDSVIFIGESAFRGCSSSSLTIYCEAESKPDGWPSASFWNPTDCPVVWGYTGEN